MSSSQRMYAVRPSWGRQALIVLVLTQTIFVFLSVLNYDDMAWDDLIMNSITFNLVGLGAFSGAYFADRLGEQRSWSFISIQVAQFIGLLLGMSLGRISGDLINYFLYDNTLLWDDPFLGWQFEVSIVLGLGLLLGALNLIRNVQVYTYQQQQTQQAYELLKLQDQMTRAQLQSIQARINPHFLYNALNGIASMIPSHPDRAEAMTLGLSRLFRASLDAANQPMSTIQEELRLIETYLDIEEARFGERLSYTIDVPKAEMETPVPRFLLQPLVENAIKHGVSQQFEPGHIAIQVQRSDDGLHIRVGDNGPDFPKHLNAGYGLQSVQDSLALLYPDRHDFALVQQPKKYVEITIEA